MSTVEIHEIPVVIPGLTKDDAWHVVDVSSLLVNPNAVTVIIWLKAASGNRRTAVREIGNTLDSICTVNVFRSGYTAVNLSASNTFEYKLSSSEASIDIMGELVDHVVAHANPSAPLEESGDWNVWVLKVVELEGDDTFADVEAVIIRGHQSGGAFFSTIGIRKPGSGDPTFQYNHRVHGTHWYIMGIDANGVYETFLQGFDGLQLHHWNEIGYIKKSSKLKTISPALPVGFPLSTPDFGVANFSGVVPSGTITVGGSLISDEITGKDQFHFIGTNQSEVLFTDFDEIANRRIKSHAVKLKNLKCKYIKQSLLTNFWLHWYETGAEGKVKGQSEASAAVSGEGETSVAVSGGGEASVAVSGEGEAGAARKA